MSEVQVLLLTDVVDSTRLSETLDESALAALWEAHDRAARDLLAAAGGREIDKTDGMMTMFSSATDALAFARRYHAALQALPVALSARAGLHVGPVILRHNSAADIARGAKPIEVDGVAKPTVARVMALARGGQTLLTAEAGAALASAAPRLASHGHWVLKGLAEPVEVFEVVDSGLRPVPPSDGEKAHRVTRVGGRWLPVSEVPNNLPQPLTSFIGREAEIDDVEQRLGATRLLTVTGSGGCGKTRLALQAAHELLHVFADGVWLVELAALSEPQRVTTGVARVLGLKDEPGVDLLQALVKHLQGRQVLLVLDNAEHLLTACAALADTLLRQCPRLTLLVTSREPLGIGGEVAIRVPSLALPNADRAADPETLARCESVRLLVARARAHSPHFTLTRENAAALAAICRRLDGIPLAIELAAARLRSLGVAELHARLDQRFRVLTGGARNALPRQQTLRALIDWSHDLLDAREKRLLHRLSVFVGGWTLGAAEQVCGSEGDDGEAALDTLTALADKSLVLAEPRHGVMRFRLLETVRQYARDRLLEGGEAHTGRERHLQYCLRLAKEAEPNLRGADQQRWLTRLEDEHDNLRAALTWACADGGDLQVAFELADALFKFWYVRSHVLEALDWYARLLPAADRVPSALAASVLAGAGVMAWQHGDAAMARTCGERSLAIQRTLDNPLALASALLNVGLVDFSCGDYAAARSRFEEGLGLRRAQGHARGVASALHNLGAVAVVMGDDADARRRFQESLELYRSLNDAWGVAMSLSNLAPIVARQGEPVAAHALNRESLTLRHGLGDRQGMAESLEALAHDHASAARPLRAARLWGAAEQLRTEIGTTVVPADREARDRQVALARQAVGDEAAFDGAWQAGGALPLAQAIDEALRGDA